MTPWLGLAAVAAIGAFVFPFTGFTFYTVSGFLGQQGEQTWGGWLSIPHTSSLVLAVTLGILLLVVAAARGHSPINPSALGAVIAVLAFGAAARILFRILESPFTSAGGAENVQVRTVEVGFAAFLGLAFAVLALVAGLAQAVTHRDAAAEEPARHRVDRTAAGPA